MANSLELERERAAALKAQLGIEAPAAPVSGPTEAPVPGVQEIFDLDPTVKSRGAIVPLGEDAEGNVTATPSDLGLSLLDLVTLPGRVLKGHKPTDEELLNFFTAIVGSAPRGALQGLTKVKPGAVEPGSLEARAATEAAETAAREATETGVPRGGAGVDDLQAAARKARFDEQGIPATRGDVTQDFAQQADESRLVSMAGGPEAEPLRQMRLQQSEVFKSKVQELVDSLGVPESAGTRIKDALSGRIELLRSQKKDLYKLVADASPEVANAPLLTDEIVLAIPDAKTVRRLRTLAPNAVTAVDNLLVEFGLNTSDDAVKAFTKSGGEVTPLTLGNFDDFRIALNQIDRADQTGAVKVITGPVRQALDEEAKFIDDAIKESGVTDEGVITALKQARERVRTLKTEFSPQSITGRLTGVKRDGVTPVIEASKVSGELLRPGAPIENLQRTLASLGKAGDKGKAAIGDLQASVVMDALEAALKAPSRKTSGIQTVAGNEFAKSLDKFGADKLDLLFKGNEKTLGLLRALRQTGLDISPAAGAVPKGSAPVILDLVNKLGKVPGLSAVSDIANGLAFIHKVGGDKRAVATALDSASPVMRQTVRTIQLKYPALNEIIMKLGVIQSNPSQPQILTEKDLEDKA